MTTLDVAVACSGAQSPDWWSPLIGNLLAEQKEGKFELAHIWAVQSALPDHNKNHNIGGVWNPTVKVSDEIKPGVGIAPATEGDRNRLTDANRVEIARRYLSLGSDWIFWIDDDTVPPMGAIGKLMSHGRVAMAGLYYYTKPPYHPIAYMRRGNSPYYDPIWTFPYGSVMQVDSVGMGCTLVHRSVYEKIIEAHTVLMRPNGSLFAVHNSRVQNLPSRFSPEDWQADGCSVNGNLFTQRVYQPGEDDNRPFPFYALEYGRTEDHHFWELAASVGIHPWIDSTVNCAHYKLQPTERNKYRDEWNRQEVGS